jgi:hypothetical protein
VNFPVVSSVIVCGELILLLLFIIFSWVRLRPFGTEATTGLLYEPKMMDSGDCGAIGGIKIGRENRSTRREPNRTPLCPLEIPHGQIWDRTLAATVEASD